MTICSSSSFASFPSPAFTASSTNGALTAQNSIVQIMLPEGQSFRTEAVGVNSRRAPPLRRGLVSLFLFLIVAESSNLNSFIASFASFPPPSTLYSPAFPRTFSTSPSAMSQVAPAFTTLILFVSDKISNPPPSSSDLISMSAGLASQRPSSSVCVDAV